MKVYRGSLPQDLSRNDNFWGRRYIAKHTINSAIAHGVAHEVGSIEGGKLADPCIWKPAFFGVKPDVIIRGGFISCSVMGDMDAPILTPQPMIYRSIFGSFGGATAGKSVSFEVRADGELLACDPAEELPMAQRYFLF